MAIIQSDLENLLFDARAFACPGLYRIVPAKDGGICRVRVALGQVSPAQIRAIAATARDHGNRVLELTNRANIQIRGLTVGEKATALSALEDAGLAPAERWADDMRNVLVTPSAGFDPDEIVDVRPAAKAILDVLSGDVAHAALSPKFSVQIDGGGAFSVGDHPHDVWFLAISGSGGAPFFKIGLASAVDYGASGGERYCAAGECADVVRALVAEFIESGVRGLGVSRLRDLIRLKGSDDLWRRAEIRLGRQLAKVSSDGVQSLATPTTRAPLGEIVERDGTLRAVAAAPVFGRCDADAIEVIADVAERLGRSDIRLTPWRSVLIPGIAADHAASALDMLATAGFIVGDDDPLAHRIACSGTIGCASALSDVQGDARRLDGAIHGTVHFSGCAKSCAVPGAADFTLVAVSEGLYDLHRRNPSGTSRFGTLLASRIDVAAARQLIGELAA